MVREPRRTQTARMKLTDGLLGEHALFYELFDRVEDIVDGAETLNQVLAAVSLLGSAVSSHAELEESLLFSELDAGIPVSVLRAEHAEIQRLVTGIPGVRELEVARDAAHALLGVLRNHFHREEHLLFPTSESELGEQKLLELGARWAERRGLF